MKKAFAVFLTVCLNLSIAACSDRSPASAPSSDPNPISVQSAEADRGSSTTSGTTADTGESSVTTAPPINASVDNAVRPRRVSADNPLFNFKAVTWNVVPEDLRRNAAIVYDGFKVDSINFDALKKNHVPVILQLENWNSWEKDPVIPVDKLETLFKKYDNIIGVSFVEQSCAVMNEIQIARMIETMNLCGKYKALFIWEDGAGNNLDNVFAIAGRDSRLYNTIKANREYVILINKMVGSQQHFLNQSLIMGFWLSDLCTAWGVNCEDFYWWESGFSLRYQDTQGWEHTGLANITRSRYCVPDALIGQMMGLSMIQGASVFSFENADRILAHGNTMVPVFSKVIHPLHTMAQNGAIPSKEQVRSRIRVVYHADDWESQNIRLPGEALFRDLYGCNQYTDDFILSKKVSPEFIPYNGRYFNLPVIPTLGKDAATQYFSTILDSKTLPADKKGFFDSLYAANATGDACVMDVDNLRFISNPYENSNISSDFGIVSVKEGQYRLGGTLQPHSYLYVTEFGGKVQLHINNYTVDTDTAVWNNPQFEGNAFLDEYIKPDCKWAQAQRKTVITVKGIKDTGKISSSGGVVDQKVNGDTITLTIQHNGPVDITLS